MAFGDMQLTNGEDYIDSRDILARIEYLADFTDEESEAERASLDEFLGNTALSKDTLESGVTFTRETYFVTSAKELADDIHPNASLFGTRPTSWPFMHVDWEEAADSLRSDYSEAEFDGVTYLYQG